jgi:hypothetical protein
VLYMTELKIVCVVFVALLLLSQRCIVIVICCLAVNWEILQGSLPWMDVRTLIKYHVLLGKSALECYQS